MRRAGPFIILIIGVLALFVDFLPGLAVPDPGSADGSWRKLETKLGLDLKGGLRVEYQAQPVEGRSPSSGDMAIIKDIVERRVNGSGVSEPVVTTQGSDRVVVEMPGVTDPDADPEPDRPDRPARLRAARQDDGAGGPDPRPQGESTVVQRRPGAVGDDRPGHERRNRRRLRAQGRRRQPLRRLHGAARRRLLRDHAGLVGDLGSGHPELHPERERPDQRRRARRVHGQGSQQPGHRAQVRFAAVPDQGAVDRPDQRHAGQPVPQSEPAGRVRSASRS